MSQQQQLSQFLRKLPIVDEWHDSVSISSRSRNNTNSSSNSSISLDEDDADDNAMDDGRLERATHQRKRYKGVATAMGLSINDDSFVVPEIQRRPLMREDGYTEDAAEAWIAPTRPYNREYLNEQQQREQILSRDPQYRFLRRIAGALRKRVTEVVDEEDMSRVMRERAAERRTDELERQRTLVSMREKTEIMQRLTTMVEHVRERYTLAQAARPGDALNDLSFELFSPRSAVNFDAVLHWAEEYELVQRISADRRSEAHQDDVERIEAFVQSGSGAGDLDDHDLDALQRAWRRLSTPMRRYALYFAFLYHRDFLDLADIPLTRARFTQRRDYVVRLSDNMNLKGESTVEQFPERDASHDWSQRYGGMELIDLARFEQLAVGVATEREMIQRIPPTVYSAKFIETLLGYVYDATPIALDDAIKRRDPLYARMRPLLLRGATVAAATTERGYTSFSEGEVDSDLARPLVRAHLLWVYFDEVDMDDFIELLYLNQTQLSRVINNMGPALLEMLPPLQSLRDGYVPLVNVYLGQLALYMNEARSITGTGERVFRVPNHAVTLHDETLYRTGDRVDALVHDALFRQYLREGKRVFETTAQTGKQATATKEGPLLREAPPPEYPVLVLQLLFDRYRQFLEEYLVYAERELARGERALEKARAKISGMLGDERVERNDRDDPLLYRQRKAWVSQPVNSGYVKFNAETDYLVKSVYHETQRVCKGLRGLPLEGFHCESAFSSGLTEAFARAVAAQYSYNDLSINQQYNSLQHTKSCHTTMKGAWLLLHEFSYSGFGGAYVIHGGTPPPIEYDAPQLAPATNFTLGAM